MKRQSSHQGGEFAADLDPISAMLPEDLSFIKKLLMPESGYLIQ
jgi:hypothetical protein